MIEGTKIEGCYTASYAKKFDSRGFFTRVSSLDDVNNASKDFVTKQVNMSYNPKAGTFRGLHCQSKPFGESKVFTCVSGSVDLFILDVRKDSETYKVLEIIRMNATDNINKIVITPKYCATGYMTLEDDSAMMYQVDEFFHPESCIGFNVLDVATKIGYDMSKAILSDIDKNAQKFSEVGGI